jgi:hypothetical protein
MERVALILMLAARPAWAFDANGVALGTGEAEVRKDFPEARCKPMPWKTAAADRRCDAAPIKFGGAEARITFYLRQDAVQAFDLRFDARDLERVADFLRARFGTPETQGRQAIERFGKTRELYKMRWKEGADQAVLTSQIGQRRVDLNVWRGDFDAEVNRIR